MVAPALTDLERLTTFTNRSCARANLSNIESSAGDKTSKNLYASLTGAVSGNDIQWVKTYDGTGGGSHSVTYQGKVDRKAGKIVGKWQIKADWSGPFELSRE